MVYLGGQAPNFIEQSIKPNNLVLKIPHVEELIFKIWNGVS
mgnify:CR=1 FL=1